MLARLRLLRGAAALLYFGPLFAGLSGSGWDQVPFFVAIFVLWLIILRPEQWPATPAEWLTASAWGAALTQVLSQILLVAVLFGIGRGFGGIAGFLPVINPLLPAAISFLAIPLGRSLWDAREAAEAGVFLDEEAERAQIPRAAADAALAIVPLLNLPDDAPEAQVSPLVSNIMYANGAALRLNALTAALKRPDRTHAALRRALVIWASEPEVVAPGLVPDAMANAFSIADGSPDLLRLLVPRAMALIGAFPGRADGFPAPTAIRQVAADGLVGGPTNDLPSHLRDDLRDGLIALAHAVEMAQAQTQPTADPVRREAPATAQPRHA
ncbi:hypothetical protein [Tabrizicola sp.]|uniref:hypothetical protein n=1 Tax=Tabrizicola sp. TaxID=2005166 RepID=UPI003F3608B8